MLDKLLQAARKSNFGLLALNFLLPWMVPFNAPHGISIISLKDESIRVKLPFKRRNKNHVGGLHACALATASEYATGILLLSQLGSEYRMLMKTLQVEYLYQGRKDARIECDLSKDWIEESIRKPLLKDGTGSATTEARAFDLDGNQLCTTTVTWHFKRWDSVHR